MSTYYLPDIVANTWNELQVINNVHFCVPKANLLIIWWLELIDQEGYAYLNRAIFL